MGSPLRKYEIAASIPKELTETRRPLVMATERSVKYHQVTPPSSVCSSCYPLKGLLIRPFGSLSKMQGARQRLVCVMGSIAVMGRWPGTCPLAHAKHDAGSYSSRLAGWRSTLAPASS